MGMPITHKNVEAAMEIFKILADKKCTVADAHSVLSYVGMKLDHNTTVPELDYSELFGSELKACDDE
ncbi:MAG: hypothetical protein J6C96_12650 [Oscillospiraceae bacterium]|nr:hypothetical protein [Oscillospiraceae bacterium]